MTNQKPRIAIPLPTSTDEPYNKRCWPQYAAAVVACGAVAVPIDLHAVPEEVAKLAAACEAILLPGSPADIQPQKYGQQAEEATAPADGLREAVDELLLQDAFNLGKPIFGVCYGHQSINVWRGGTLTQHLNTGTAHDCGKDILAAHQICISPISSPLSRCMAAPLVAVNSSHHQAVAAIGDGLRVAAVCPDDGTIEAIVGMDMQADFVVGVQWHPERTYLTDSGSLALFKQFIAAASRLHH